MSSGFGSWIAFGTQGGVRGSTPPSTEQARDIIGLTMLPPPTAPTSPTIPASPIWATGSCAGTGAE